MYGLPHPSLSRLIMSLLCALSAAGVQSCGSNPTSTEPDTSATADLTGIEGAGTSLVAGEHPADRGFFPLAIGNTWTYETQSSWFVQPDSCGTPCVSFGGIEGGHERRELVGTETLLGQEYVVEEQTRRSDCGFGCDTVVVDTMGVSMSPMAYRVYYRQDRAGLYEAYEPFDGATSPVGGLAAAHGEPAPRAISRVSETLQREGMTLTSVEAEAYEAAGARLQAKREVLAAALAWHGQRLGPIGDRRGGALDHELTRLKYPLNPGQRWVINDDPMFTSRVVKYEVLRLAAGRLGGYRILIESELFDPKDTVTIWYGRTGFLRMSVLLHGEAVDEWGYHVGTVVSREHMALESFTLVPD